jgi:hypothetical protein
MKFKHYFTLVLIVFTSLTFGQKIRVITIYFPYPDSEQISTEYEYYKKGRIEIPHGYFKEYFKNGNLLVDANYSNGFRIGKYTEFYESGSIRKLGNYESENNGALQEFFENGNLLKSSIITNGKEKVLKNGFENGNYAVYSENDVLDYYNKNDVLIRSIKNNRKNEINISEKQVYYIHYPEILIDNDKEGLVICQMFVDELGVISNVKVLESFDQRASDVVLIYVRSIQAKDLASGEKQDVMFSIQFEIN